MHVFTLFHLVYCIRDGLYDMISAVNIIDYMLDDMDKDMISTYTIICYVCTMLSLLSMRLIPRKIFFLDY